MAYGAWNKEQAEQASAMAEKELNEILQGFSAEQREALVKFQSFWQKWYNGASGYHATGHKALARILLGLKVE